MQDGNPALRHLPTAIFAHPKTLLRTLPHATTLLDHGPTEHPESRGKLGLRVLKENNDVCPVTGQREP